jgi:exodeoxyribonuclease-3
MKIVSWNVNGIRAVERKGDLQVFLGEYNPDVFCLQEIKGKPEQFSKFLTEHSSYQQFYHPAEKPGYAGTSIWVKKSKNLKVNDFVIGFPDEFEYLENEGRISRIDFSWKGKEYAILGVYFPNGGKSVTAWDDKLIFYDKFLQYVNKIRNDGVNCIWTGDINCAHEEIDLARPKENKKSIGFLPEERAWVSQVIHEDWVDVFRKTYPTKIKYSWWHLITRSRAKNVGWRIDYFFMDTNLFSEVKNIEYLNNQMGSDHCPVMLEI